MAIYKDAILQYTSIVGNLQYTRTDPSIAFETFNSLNVCSSNVLRFYQDHGLMLFIPSLNTPLNNGILMCKLCTDYLHAKNGFFMCILLLPFSVSNTY